MEAEEEIEASEEEKKKRRQELLTAAAPEIRGVVGARRRSFMRGLGEFLSLNPSAQPSDYAAAQARGRNEELADRKRVFEGQYREGIRKIAEMPLASRAAKEQAYADLRDNLMTAFKDIIVSAQPNLKEVTTQTGLANRAYIDANEEYSKTLTMDAAGDDTVEAFNKWKASLRSVRDSTGKINLISSGNQDQFMSGIIKLMQGTGPKDQLRSYGAMEKHLRDSGIPLDEFLDEVRRDWQSDSETGEQSFPLAREFIDAISPPSDLAAATIAQVSKRQAEKEAVDKAFIEEAGKWIGPGSLTKALEQAQQAGLIPKPEYTLTERIAAGERGTEEAATMSLDHFERTVSEQVQERLPESFRWMQPQEQQLWIAAEKNNLAAEMLENTEVYSSGKQAAYAQIRKGEPFQQYMRLGNYSDENIALRDFIREGKGEALRYGRAEQNVIENEATKRQQVATARGQMGMTPRASPVSARRVSALQKDRERFTPLTSGTQATGAASSVGGAKTAVDSTKAITTLRKLHEETPE